MDSEEAKHKLAKTREELAEFLGDCREWPNLLPPEFTFLPCCPQCGAGCLNPYQHKAWHLQNGI